MSSETVSSPEPALAPDLKPGVLEHGQHGPVLREHLRIETPHPALAPDHRQLLEHPGRRSAALEVVGDRERGLGCARLAELLVLRHPDDPAAVAGDQRGSPDPARLDERLGDPSTRP